jgi:hypothetical protein
VIAAWNDFFHKPQSTLPVALFRMLYGLLTLCGALLLWPDLYNFLGEHAIISAQTAAQLSPGPRLNLLAHWPGGDAGLTVFFAIYLTAALGLTLGCCTRLSAVLVFVGLNSIHLRNTVILHSGDTFMRVTGFFLMFAPAGECLSLDRLWRLWRQKPGTDDAAPALHAPWAQRFIQIEMSLLYFCTFLWKSQGQAWANGTAIYYTSRLEEFYRFPVPYFFDHLWTIKLLTWGALFIEFLLGTAVWIREFRYWVLAAGVGLHLGIEYSMNIPLFEWIMICTYVTFIEPEDLQRVFDRVRGWLAVPSAARYLLVTDVACEGCRRRARLVGALDIRSRYELVSMQNGKLPAGAPARHEGLLLRTPEGHWITDEAAFANLCRMLPTLWPLYLAQQLPPLRRRLTGWFQSCPGSRVAACPAT